MFETQYYTVKMPEAWVGKCVDYIEESEDGTSIVTFYEKECYMTSYSGKICSIQLLPEDVDWSSVEDAGLFGGLKTPDGFFIIVGVFPEDRQYSDESKETYDTLQALTPDLFGTLTAKEGCELSRAGLRHVDEQCSPQHYFREAFNSIRRDRPPGRSVHSLHPPKAVFL